MTKVGTVTVTRQRVLVEGFEFAAEGHDPRTQDHPNVLVFEHAMREQPEHRARLQVELDRAHAKRGFTNAKYALGVARRRERVDQVELTDAEVVLEASRMELSTADARLKR